MGGEEILATMDQAPVWDPWILSAFVGLDGVYCRGWRDSLKQGPSVCSALEYPSMAVIRRILSSLSFYQWSKEISIKEGLPMDKGELDR